MGGSSIVAAVVINSIATLFGLTVDNLNLIYLVTQVEQILSSGGGYQDQQGSIYGGFKIGRSANKLPMLLSVEVIPVTQSFISTFEKRCYLIYTGQQRLAKNILINALRNCSLTASSSDNTVTSLINGAEAGCRLLLSHYDNKTSDDDCIDSLAAILDNYFKLKVQMAPGTDPEHIKDIIKNLHHLSKGISLAGAGGGGYAIIILQKGYVKEDLVRTVEEYNSANRLNLTVHDVTIDTDGILSKTVDTLYANLKDYLLI
jgi:fucokinase